MEPKLITHARSPLGTWIALALVTLMLLLVGLYLATNGSFFLKVPDMVASVPGGRALEAPVKGGLTALADKLKAYKRPELLMRYALAIVVSFAIVGFLGSFLRTYQFAFRKQTCEVVRRAMWFYVPARAGIGFGVFLLVAWLVRQAFPDAAFFWGYLPVWFLLAIALTAAALVAVWWFLRHAWRFHLYVPGRRKYVDFAKVSRLEIEASAEGGTLLTMTFADQGKWTLSRGSQKRLSRRAEVLARMLGLERQDHFLWKRA